MNEREFPRTLEAVEATEITVWGIAKAVYEEVRKTEAGNARHGEYDKIVEFLADHGYREYSKHRIEEFFQVAKWANPGGHPDLGHPDFDFTQFPFSRVHEAKKAAKSDHVEAWKLLRPKTHSRWVGVLTSHVLEAKDKLNLLREQWEDEENETERALAPEEEIDFLREELESLVAEAQMTLNLLGGGTDADEAFSGLLGGE